MAVHDVEVQPIGAGGLDRCDLVAQARKSAASRLGATVTPGRWEADMRPM